MRMSQHVRMIFEDELPAAPNNDHIPGQVRRLDGLLHQSQGYIIAEDHVFSAAHAFGVFFPHADLCHGDGPARQPLDEIFHPVAVFGVIDDLLVR